jgi:hypothetical protein
MKFLSTCKFTEVLILQPHVLLLYESGYTLEDDRNVVRISDKSHNGAQKLKCTPLFETDCKLGMQRLFNVF